MLGWKVFAAFSALLWVWSVGKQLLSAKAWNVIDVFGYPIATIAILGLVAYAFSLKIFSQTFWKVFHLILLGWTTFSVRQILEGNSALGIKIAAAAIIAGIMGFNWLAIYRLAGSPWTGRIKRTA